MKNIKDVTHATTGDVMAWVNGLEDAFAKFERWLKRQKFNVSERTIADTIFNLRFASMSMNSLIRAQSAASSIGKEREAEIRAKVKAFAVRNKFCSDKGFDDPEVDE